MRLCLLPETNVLQKERLYYEYEIFIIIMKYLVGSRQKKNFGHVSVMGKPEVHYLRETLVKPLCPPGLEHLSLPGEGPHLPCDSAGFARDLAHRLYRVEAKPHGLHSCDADKTPNHLKDTNNRHLLCAGSRPCKLLPFSSLFPSCSRARLLLRSQHKLLLRFSTQRS